MIDAERARALLEEIFNQGNLDAIDELYTENFVGHEPQNPIQGREALKAWVQELRRVSPDFHMNLHETLVDGDMAATRWTVTRTHAADWRGMPATNRPYVVSGITMSKFSGGKIAESWVNADNLGMLQQLGIVPQFAG